MYRYYTNLNIPLIVAIRQAITILAISVVAGSVDGRAFVTLTVVSTNDEWEKPSANESLLRRVAESFKLV